MLKKVGNFLDIYSDIETDNTSTPFCLNIRGLYRTNHVVDTYQQIQSDVTI